jgi:hypothetical protein
VWKWADRIFFGFTLFWLSVVLFRGFSFDILSIVFTLAQAWVVVQQWRQARWAFWVQVAFLTIVAVYLALFTVQIARGVPMPPELTDFVALVTFVNAISLLVYSGFRLYRWRETSW